MQKDIKPWTILVQPGAPKGHRIVMLNLHTLKKASDNGGINVIYLYCPLPSRWNVISYESLFLVVKLGARKCRSRYLKQVGSFWKPNLVVMNLLMMFSYQHIFFSIRALENWTPRFSSSRPGLCQQPEYAELNKMLTDNVEWAYEKTCIRRELDAIMSCRDNHVYTCKSC